MDHRFIVPATVAASLHALVFLVGPDRTSRDPVVTRTDEPVWERFTCALLPDPPEEIFTDEPSGSRGNPDAGRPGLDEPPPAAKPEGPTMDLLAYPPVPVVHRDRLTPGVYGEQGGEPNFAPRLGPGVLDSRHLDRAPRAKVQVAPRYPEAARRDGVSAEVVVEFMVNEQGVVYAPRVVRATRADFEGPALQAVSMWRFEPGRAQGKVVRFKMAVPLVFRCDA